MKAIELHRIERAARIYHTSEEAAQALGIGRTTFNRLCRRAGYETPGERKKRRRCSTGRLTNRRPHATDH